MAISEATALARARAVKASFPKGPISVAQARAMFVAMADSQVGYVSGNPNWSMYGKPENWPVDWAGRQVYWCVLGGGAWTPAQTFGITPARAGFGQQVNSWHYPPAGGTWTVWVLAWGRARNALVDWDDQQAGDICLTRWGRTGAEVDHFDIIRGPRTLNLANVIGFNTSASNTSAGAGVFRAARPRNRVVAIIRPDWHALVTAYNQALIDWDTIGQLLLDLGYTPDTSGVRAFQRDHGLTVDGIPGPNTTTALEDTMSQVLDKLDYLTRRVDQIHDRQSNLGQSNNNVLRKLREAIDAVPEAIAAYRNPGYPDRDVHGLWRDAATAKQGLRELATALRQTGSINAAGEATVQAATDDDNEQEN